jgi:hypothetical protein
MDAIVWTRIFKGNTILKYLRKGDRFVFPNRDQVCVYSEKCCYRHEDDRKSYRSSGNVAVLVINKEISS